MISHRRYLFAIISLAVLVTVFAVGAAHTLSQHYAIQRMNAIYSNVQFSLDGVQRQVDEALARMNMLSNQEENCSEKIYATISKLVSVNNLIYEAAFKLANGKVCSSYGREIFDLPVRFTWSHFLMQQAEYPLFLGRHIFSSKDFVIVEQVSSYLWLNKAILLGLVNGVGGVGLDVIDQKFRISVLSNGVAQLDLNMKLQVGTLTRQEGGLRMAYIHQGGGLMTVITLPTKQYQIIWWVIFTSVFVLLVLICVFLALFRNWVWEAHFSMSAKLKKGIKNDELNMTYQPIVNMCTGVWVGMEALIRWSPRGNIVSPSVFIPLAERTGIIRELTRWVVSRVAEDFSSHLWSCKGLYITINLSAQDVEDDTFGDFVNELFSRCAIPPQRIVFEVSEGSLMNRHKAAVQLQRLREQGHRIAVDDFGTGYSSLAYIEELPVDILKIDRIFLGSEKIGAPDALWRHMVSMANSLKLTVVAEGVETSDQVKALIDGDVEFSQGWLFEKALPPALFAKQFNGNNSSQA